MSMNYLVVSIVPIIIFLVVTYGVLRGVKVYECFIEGVKEGIGICIRIFPYILAMLLALTIFRESNALDYLVFIVSPLTNLIGLPKELVPLILMKPLSGSGALAVYTDILNQYGPDGYIGVVASVIMGSTETIFYTLTVYYGAVGIKKIRHTLWAAMIADFVAIIMALALISMV